MYYVYHLSHIMSPLYLSFFWVQWVARGCDLRHDGQRLHLRQGRQRQHGGMVKWSRCWKVELCGGIPSGNHRENY